LSGKTRLDAWSRRFLLDFVPQPDSLGKLAKTVRELVRIDAVRRHHRLHKRIG
jgi:hypothetical protein